jgi:hypothetical protein
VKKILILFIVFKSLSIAAQSSLENFQPTGKNELRLDVGRLLTTSGVQLTYERFLNKDFSMGVNFLLFDTNQNIYFFFESNNKRNYKVEPFVRFSISKNTKRFFYVEGYCSVIGSEGNDIKRFSDGVYGYYDREFSRAATVAIGAAIGYKFYVKKHFCMDFNIGFSSNVADAADVPALPKIGIATGYRF